MEWETYLNTVHLCFLWPVSMLFFMLLTNLDILVDVLPKYLVSSASNQSVSSIVGPSFVNWWMTCSSWWCWWRGDLKHSVPTQKYFSCLLSDQSQGNLEKSGPWDIAGDHLYEWPQLKYLQTTDPWWEPYTPCLLPHARIHWSYPSDLVTRYIP